MKKIFWFFLFLFMTKMVVKAQSPPAADKEIPIPYKEATGQQLIDLLQKETSLVFSFGDSVALRLKGRLAVQKTPATVNDVLKWLYRSLHINYKQIGGTVVLSLLPPEQTKLPPPPATIKGRIVDFETAQPLPGATVTIRATERPALSGKRTDSTEAWPLEKPIVTDEPADSVRSLKKTLITDEKGFYVFNGLPAGSYQVTVTYSGYQKNYLAGITLNGKEKTIDIKMQTGASLGEVVVQSGAHRVKAVTQSTDQQLLTEIRNATGVVSGISNEQINKTADRNAAEVVKRIAGVSVVDERFIVVRGMNERYNLTYLNDNVAPSTELYNKAFAYDLLPSSIIDRILVYKSPQADLQGDFAGGAVKIYTKNAKPVRHLDIGIQLAHRPGSTLADINSYQGGKYDFLGFDDGTRKLPSFSPSYFQSNQNIRTTDQTTLVKGFSPILDYGRGHSGPDMQFFVNFYDNWKLGQARLYDLTSVNYTHETRNYDVYNQTGNTYFFRAGGGDLNLNVNNQITDSRQTTEIGKVNVLENLTFKLNNKNELQFKNFFVNEGRVLTTLNTTRQNVSPHIDSLVYGGDPQTHGINLSFQQRLLYSGNLGGQHDFGGKRQHLDWNLGYTHTVQNVPDQRNSVFYNNVNNVTPSSDFIAGGSNVGTYDAGFLGMINRLFIKLNENAYNFSADYTLKPGKTLTLKAGTYQLYKTRETGRRFFRVNRAGLQPDEVQIPPNESGDNGWPQGYGASNPNLIFFPESYLNSVWTPKNFPNDGSGLAIYDVTSPVDSYVASEQNNAGYVMGDWQPSGSRLSINAGLRVEYDRQKVAGALGSNGSLEAIKVDHPRTSFLPSLNINYRPDSAYVVRLGYGRTVNRPDFRELAPYNDFDFQNNQTIVGNPDVTSATIDNFDLRAEFYPQSGRQNELFNAGVFYKYLSNPIEQLRISKNGYNDVSTFTDITYGNAVSARVYGVETEIRKSLSFIPLNFFRNISVIANGALIKSTTQQRDFGGGIAGADTTSIKGRPLQGQSSYVLNAGLYYENAGSGTKVSLVYNVEGPRIYAKSTGNPNSKLQAAGDSSVFKSLRPDLLQLPQHLLDISVTQRIVKSLQVKFSVQNLLNQDFRIIEDHNYNQKYDPEVPHKNTDGGTANGTTYYTGDNIFQRYNPDRYFIIQFTYAF